MATTDRGFLVIQVLLLCGVKRFSNSQNMLGRDVRKMESGDSEVYVSWSKTDQLGYGVVFHLFGLSRVGYLIL